MWFDSGLIGAILNYITAPLAIVVWSTCVSEVAVEVTNSSVQGVHLFGKITSPRGGNGGGVVSKPNEDTSEAKTGPPFWTRVVDGFDFVRKLEEDRRFFPLICYLPQRLKRIISGLMQGTLRIVKSLLV